MNMLKSLEAKLDYTQISPLDVMSTLISYDANNNPEYIGMSKPGTAADDAGWAIKKVSYDANGNPVSVFFAEGKINFDKVWNDRASYSYF